MAKYVLIPFGLPAAAVATEVAISKKIFKYHIITLIISNGEMNNIMKLVKSLEESGQLKWKQKKKKADFSVCY